MRRTNTLTILQRIAKRDRSAAAECFDIYSGFIWALATKFTDSTEEAEAATREIFIDIWQYAERADKPQPEEAHLISLIARRRLIKYLH